MKRLLILWIVLIASAGAPSQNRTDEFIAAEMKRQRIPGLSLAIVKDGAVVKAQGYGVADIARKTPATAETVYKIASVSKSLLAVGVMRLVQEGHVALDDPVGKYFAETPPAWAPITVRHLLSHTSGLVREGPAFHPQKVQSDADVVKSAYSLPLRFPPGSRYEYGNLNYFMLGDVIRRASGRPWPEYLHETIFKTAGMTSTWPTNTPASIPNRATGYVDNDKLQVADAWVALRPSGAFLSTVLDLAKWDAALESDRLLSASSRQQMWTAAQLADGKASPYGLGWFVSVTNGRRRVQHTGGMPGARAAFVKYPDDGLTIIVLSNLDDMDIDAIIEGLASRYLPPDSKAKAGA